MSDVAAARPLIGRLIPDEGAARMAALAGFAVLGSLLLWASAKVSVPFWPVPMTLQTGVVALLAAAYGWRLGLATVLLYLAEGAAGLPVFQGTPPGIGLAYMVGPTGGFLIGMAVQAAVTGWLVENGFGRNPLRIFAAMLIGDALLFVLGVAWLAWLAQLPSGAMGVGLSTAFAKGAMPFLLGDLVKLALAASLVTSAGRLVRR
jgi:biotin transport system substrate-specific component